VVRFRFPIRVRLVLNMIIKEKLAKVREKYFDLKGAGNVNFCFLLCFRTD